MSKSDDDTFLKTELDRDTVEKLDAFADRTYPRN